MPWWDSNPQSQQASNGRTMSYNALLLVPANECLLPAADINPPRQEYL